MLLRTPTDLGFAIREQRRKLQLDQRALAQQVGVSRKWIIDVEKGRPRAELGLVLRTLDTLGLQLSVDAGQGDRGAADAAPPIDVADIDGILDRARGKPP